MMRSRLAVQRHKLYRQHGQWWSADSGQDASPLFPEAPFAHITRAQLYLLQQALGFVAIPPPILEAVVRLRAQLAEKGIISSDRRWGQLLPCLQASALLRESDIVEDEDLLTLSYGLWNRPDDLTEVRKQIRRVSNPHNAKVIELLEGATKAFKEYEIAVKRSGINEEERLRLTTDMNTTLRNARNELQGLHATLTTNKQEQAANKAMEAVTNVKRMLVEVSTTLANI